MVVPFEDNKYNIKEIYLFGVFSTYMSLNYYRLCEPTYHLYRTALLYDLMQQHYCILKTEIELPYIQISKWYAC